MKAKPARAGLALPGQRSDPANFAAPGPEAIEPGEVDPRDISTILMGAQAITGKSVASAARMTVNPTQHEKLETQRKAREQEAREMASLAAWNTKTTTVGGVQMTNAQAQEARQRFVDNEDFYAERAVQLGYIKADEKEELKRGMRRKVELEDKTGRGTITEAERRELRDWDNSRVGQAGDKITAAIHQDTGLALSAQTSRVDTFKSGNGFSATRPDDLFQSAPKLRNDFTGATVASSAPEPQAPPAAPAPVSKDVNATGMNL